MASEPRGIAERARNEKARGHVYRGERDSEGSMGEMGRWSKTRSLDGRPSVWVPPHFAWLFGIRQGRKVPVQRLPGARKAACQTAWWCRIGMLKGPLQAWCYWTGRSAFDDGPGRRRLNRRPPRSPCFLRERGLDSRLTIKSGQARIPCFPPGLRAFQGRVRYERVQKMSGWEKGAAFGRAQLLPAKARLHCTQTVGLPGVCS